MKDGYIQKSIEADREALIKINAFSRTELKAEDVYTFSVVLCDNEVDRDFERFTTDSLAALAELFVGKTGIFDHSQKSSDQTARIFECNVEVSAEKFNSFGEPYACIKARAYMPRLEKNADLISEIEAGIKKEVSVGCSVGKTRCSICGRDTRREPCEHIKGMEYSGVLCCTELLEPLDAYEWSFVAVPAQPLAGVTKMFTPDKEDELKRLKKYAEELEKEAKFGRAYKKFLIEEVVKLVSFADCDADCSVLEKAADGLSADELCSLKGMFERIVAQNGCQSQFEEDNDCAENEKIQRSFLI